MKIATVGLDISKRGFQLHAADSEGRAVLRKRLRRNQVAVFFANLPACLVGLEACGGRRTLRT
jgi:transposase